MDMMPGKIADDWVMASCKYHSADYTGLVRTDAAANFYFRIIPELYGSGLNYEDVDYCGELKQFL
jgi:hypothetical protein